MPVVRESDLYAPVKSHLEAQGFTVRGEVGKCDIVAKRDELMIAVEMKIGFGLPVLYQALERLSQVDLVYVAVAAPDGRIARGNWDDKVPAAARLCRMLGVGLISVRDGNVIVVAEPAPYVPRKQPKMRARLLKEFDGRSGDHNLGGTTKRPRITVYRENALRLALLLARRGPTKASVARDMTALPAAAAALRTNVYGWFVKTRTGVYDVTPIGEEALITYADVLATQSVEQSAAPEQDHLLAA